MLCTTGKSIYLYFVRANMLLSSIEVNTKNSDIMLKIGDTHHLHHHFQIGIIYGHYEIIVP